MIRLQQRFISPRILALLLVVVTLGVILKIDLWTVPENKTEKSTAVQIISLESQTRSPASLQSVSIEEWSEPDRMQTLDWDCSRKAISKPLINVNQLRLNGSCLKDIKRLTNNINGYTANIFKFQNTYTTDFLSLNEGTNKLQIEWLDGASGNLSKELEIVVKKQ